MNKVILAGRLTKDPDIRYTQTGKAVARFTLAVNRRFTSSQNKEGQTADFIPIVVWNKLAEICGNYLFKGSKILLEGSMQVRRYGDQNGNSCYITEVIAQDIEFMSKKATSNDANSNASTSNNTESSFLKNHQASLGKEVPPDEEIPF